MSSIQPTTFIGLDVVRKIGIQRILNIVCEYLEVSVEEVKGNSRLRELVEARHVFSYFAYHSIAEHTLKQIGQVINRDHATVLHGKNRIGGFMDCDKRTQKIVAALKNRLGNFTADDVANNKITAMHVGYYDTYKKKKDLQYWSKKNDVVSKLVIN